MTKRSVHSGLIPILFGLLVISLERCLLRAQQNTGSISGTVDRTIGEQRST